MASSRSTRSSGSVVFQHSTCPSGRFSTASGHGQARKPLSSSAFASYTSSSFSTRPSSSSFHRSASPTRVNLVGSVSPSSSSVRFSIDPRSISPGRSLSVSPSRESSRPPPQQRRTCMCSPTTHPGSFRCALHKNTGFHHGAAAPATTHRLNARRSAMTNSLVRIGTVEGDLVKRALAALIRPSSHQQKRRAAFQPRPSRLSIVSKAEDAR